MFLMPRFPRSDRFFFSRSDFIRFASIVVLALGLTGGIGHPSALADQVNQSFIGGVAIEGTDPVAYFRDGKPVEGSSQYSHEWNGAEWHFSSQENRDLFVENPEKYAPAYGGYCAYAVSKGYTASIDPEAWKIVDGTLYLNYNLDVQKTWAKDIPGNIQKGDSNWPTIKKGL